MTIPDPRVTLSTGDRFADRYVVEGLIGMGGMGAVYRVRDGERRAALKVLRGDLAGDPALQRRFVREAKAARAIDSPHVAEVLDAGIDERSGLPFLVLELLEGAELGQLLAARGRLGSDEVAPLLGQLADALDRAHALGVVHRDLKPSNLYLTQRDGAPHLTVIDFGVAKLIEATVTGPATEGLVGTPLYMAPEQVQAGTEAGPACDRYALGHIAYTLLTGEPYYAEEQGGVGVLRLLAAIVTGPDEPASTRALRRRGARLPTGFDRWFARASAVDPAHRFSSAAEAVTALAMAMGPGAIATESAASAWSGAEAVVLDEPVADEPIAEPPMEGAPLRLVVVAVLVVAAAVGLYVLTVALT